ncbi:MAG TPA: DUF2268 domain-containing putative Zn-dependent protease, partial [Lacipirellulaceae bacterium]
HDMHGVGGFTAGAGKIWLTVLPRDDWQDWITYTVAHEYHHSAWTARRGELSNMADYLIFEGRADSFAQLVDPRQAPWTNALTPEQENVAWPTIERHLGSTDPRLMQALMFGGAGGSPRWAGYTIGFHIVQRFLKRHPDWSVRQWTEVSTNELLKQAAYAPGQ